MSIVEQFEHYMAEYNELAANPTSEFYQELARARELLPKPIAGVLVAPAVRDRVIQEFPKIDRQFELFQAAFAHADASLIKMSPKSDALMSEIPEALKKCIGGSADVPRLIDIIRMDMAKFVFPDLNGFIEEGSFEYSLLKESAQANLADSALSVSPAKLVDATLKRLDRAQEGLGKLKYLYAADLNETKGWQHHAIMCKAYEARLAPIQRVISLLETPLAEGLHRIKESLLRPSGNQKG